MWFELTLYQSRMVGRLARRVPLLRPLLEWRYGRLFARRPTVNLYRGVYRDFAEAQRAAPDPERMGYDRAETTRIYDERLDRVFPSDYPMMFWLSRILQPGSSVFDLGGHVGIGYHAYGRYLHFPRDLRWTVCDVPAVVEAGRALAAERRADGLQFTVSRDAANGADVLMASGSLQYIEEPLAQLLERLAHKPTHLLLNKLPLYDGESFVTLQGIGVTFCPYHVFNQQEFFGALNRLGYELVDRWDDIERSCRIPFDPAHSVDVYSGVYLRAKAPAA